MAGNFGNGFSLGFGLGRFGEKLVHEGFIYFAHANRWDQRVFKVGFSKQPRWRIKELSTAASPLTEIVIVPGTLEAEQALHEMLSAYRVNKEWYRAGTRLHRIISYCDAHGKLPDIVSRAGAAWLVMREAKRSYVSLLREAGEFFRNDAEFGITRENDPFPMGRRASRECLSWLPRKRMGKNTDA